MTHGYAQAAVIIHILHPFFLVFVCNTWIIIVIVVVVANFWGKHTHTHTRLDGEGKKSNGQKPNNKINAPKQDFTALHYPQSTSHSLNSQPIQLTASELGEGFVPPPPPALVGSLIPLTAANISPPACRLDSNAAVFCLPVLYL